MTGARTIDPDELTIEAVKSGALRQRPVTVLGFARSGIALARFLVDAGARVTVYDGRPAGELTEALEGIEGRPVQLMAGPDLDPATSWRDAALVTTSPSINPDFPTTEPRLREALRALVAARGSGDPTAPAIVSEADLFLRLCPSTTIGVTGTKGKTTTSSLIAAVLDAEPGHPVVLGGNIGLPLVGLVFVIETLSVVIQVAYFKMTGGRRIFRMSPLHHHYELAGWDEEKITLRFWIDARNSVTPMSPAMMPTIQNRSVIFSSSQPASS